MNSSSTTDSSYNKGSQSRLSSRIEPHLSNKELLISHSAKSAHFDIKSSTQPNQWTVTKEVEWGKLSGLDDFTLEKSVEHEITGDVLLELDVNSLKEIDISAFGRTQSPFFNQNQSSSSPDLAGSTHSHQIPSRNDFDGPLTVNQNSNSSFTRPYHSNLKYPYQSYYPTPDTKLDAGQEELEPHLSQNSLVSKQSSIQLHQKQSSDPLTRYQSKSSFDAFQIGHCSSHDSWSPISKPFIGSRAEDPAERAIESLNPTVSIDVDLNKSTKRGKKSKHLGGSKSIGTETMMLGKKSLPVDPSLSPPIGDRPSDMGSGKSCSSFLGTLRGCKPPPKLSSQMLTSQGNGLLTSHAEAEVRPSSSSGVNGRSSRGLFHFGSDKLPAQPQHQLHHLSPLLESKSLSSMIKSENKRPELTDTNTKQGWMRKKDDKYLTWKLRYFILKGANLYYLKGPTEICIKGLIKLSGFKVVMDSDVNPGRYGFRIIHDNNTTHSFSADDPKVLRDWMKAMMKATIQRDWTAPVTSSCNIRTISIREAQKMFPPPRPPSPLSSIRLQKARLAANPDLLTDKDAAVLMSIQKFQSAGPGLMSPPESPIPSISVKVESRPLKTNQFQPSNQSVITSPSTLGFGPKNQLNDEQLLDWINNQLPKDCPTKATDFLQSIKNGMIIVRLVENLTGVQSGLSDNRFLANNDIKTDNKKLFEDEEFELYFCVFDYLNNQNIPLEGYSLNDMISGNSIKTKEFLLRIYGKFDKVK
ncbi:hypothetical protein O181_052920 [Austropuccinia psidii MF-1]|uniref:PH domain-containing protein n=1 Tax=Austropuccinia psidii MF-1 TaxID=1389203 RepID=A0A9Q3HT36_9BASI|nr:hypothetical protein [Austropuccinia psidii MF-1]